MIRSKNGQSIIELIIAMALASIFLPALLTGLVTSRSGKAQQQQRLEAVSLLKEAEEAVRIVRERGWATFATNGTFHPIVSGNTWSLSAGPEVINGYTRSVVVSDVYRDTNGNIVATGGSLDPSTKKLVTSVSWNTPLSSSVTSTIYLTRYLGNRTFVQTTDTDFNAGTQTGVAITNTSGGEVILGAGGWGDWCKPNLSISAVDLPKQGVANALSAIEGKAFAGTGDNASGISYANVLISNTNPPQATVSGTFDGYKTNGIFGETNYAYLATDTNAKQGVIIDLTQLNQGTGKYAEAGSLNIQVSNSNGQSIYVSGNTAYLTATNDKLYSFNITNRTGSHTPMASVNLDDVGNKVIVQGNKAYVAINDSSNQLQIIQINNNGASFGTPVSISVPGQNGRDIFINSSGTRAYLVTGSSPTQKEFFIIDIDPTSPTYKQVKGSFDTSGMDPKGVTVVTGNKAIVVGTGGTEYQVINIADESNPTACGTGLNIDSGINGVASVLEQDGDAYSYIITGDSSAELKIIEGGPGGQYALSGTFESNTMASPSATNPTQITLNRFGANIAQPASTNIKLQVAAANAVNGSCNGVAFTYVGPDGTANTYFTSSNNTTISGAFPLSPQGNYLNPAFCYRYKAYLSTTDKNATSVLYDITTNFSP